MDRPIEKKIWSFNRLLKIMIVAAIIVIGGLYVLFYDSNSYLNVDKTQLQITSVVMSDFAEYIPIEGTVYPKTVYILMLFKVALYKKYLLKMAKNFIRVM